MIPIPKFEEKNAKHLEPAEISQSCHKVLATKDFADKSTVAARSEARTLITKELERIDELVSGLLSLQ